MTGVLTPTSTGLILAETCEAYLNGWAFDAGGSNAVAGLISKAHSGSYSFRKHTKTPFGDGSYARLTKSVDVKSGANRIVRIFRGPGAIADVYDDFNGTSVDSVRWPTQGGVSVANSIVTVAQGEYVLETMHETGHMPGGITLIARLKPGSTIWKAWARGANEITIEFDRDADHKVKLICMRNGSSQAVAGEAYAYEWHTWKVVWTPNGGTVYLYKDGVLAITNAGYGPNEDAGDTRWMRFQNGTNGNNLLIDWVGWMTANHIKASLAIGASTIFDTDVQAETAALDNAFFDKTWLSIPVGETGSKTVELKIRNTSGSALGMKNAEHLWDDLVLMLDSTITIKGLLGGQKIELYDSGGSLRKSGTCPGAGIDVVLTGIDALIATAYGFSGYFKVYDTDGATLLYTSSTDIRWGGDVYTWLPNESKCEISTDYTLIYRDGSGLSPTSATVTVTLTNKDTGAKLSGKTIQWTGGLGTCSPTSSDTDSNGQASTTFSAGANPGLGGVRADFAGDATYGPSSALQLIDIYCGQPTPDSSKDFQFWIAGQEAVVGSGKYKAASDFKPQSFSFTTPLMSLSVGGWWAIEIYRKGVREFIGRIFTRSRQGGPNPQLTLTGVDEIVILQRRVANKAYTDEPKVIIEDLLTRYPCGVTAGSIAAYGAPIKLEATYENLYDALVQIAKDTGWKFRLNPDRTLDFGPSFGITRDITITIGKNAVQTSHDEDWTQIDTKVYVIGAGSGVSLVSTAEDPTGQLTYGLIEEPFLEKNISEQGTLDLRAQEILNQRKDVKDTIGVDWVDTLATGAYMPHDSLTVTDADAGLSGTYIVKSISRDLADANKAGLELANRLDTIADALQTIRKDVKDLGVA